jgi:hypothetical protein
MMGNLNQNRIYIVFFSVIILVLLGLSTFKNMDYFLSKFTNPESLCRTNDNGNSYCRYKGLIEGVYANSDGLQLFFIGDEVTIDEAGEKGLAIVNGQAVSLLVNGYGSVSSARMAELLEFAYANSVPVEIHMRNTEQGYLLVDRVWLR